MPTATRTTDGKRAVAFMELDVPGPDGFLFSLNDPLRAEHLRVNEYLLAEENRPSNAPFETAPWRKLPKHRLADYIQAVLRRVAWLHEHNAELEHAHLARLRLRALVRVLYSIKAPVTEAQLRTLLDLTTPLLGRMEPFGPVERAVDDFQDQDLTPALEFPAELSGRFSPRAFDRQGGPPVAEPAVGHAALVRRMGTAGSGAVLERMCSPRRSRADRGAAREMGRPAQHIRGNAPTRMPAGWAREAKLLLDGVGLEAFRDQIQLWFAPFRSGQPLALSLAGSHVAKGLMWFCAVAKDQDLKESCLWLLDVRWQQKRNADKVMTALVPFGVSKEDLLTRKLIRPTPPDLYLRWLEKMLKSPAIRRGQVDMSPSGEMAIVQGQLHFYRLFRSTGRIERVSDNAVLEFDWPAMPDLVRVGLRRDCDSPEQLVRRAEMLRWDAIYGRYFVVI